MVLLLVAWTDMRRAGEMVVQKVVNWASKMAQIWADGMAVKKAEMKVEELVQKLAMMKD
jgi:hypothetical protein